MVGRAAIPLGCAAAFCIACGAAERDPADGSGGTPSGSDGGARSGGAHSGGVVSASGGATARGGASSGGVAAGGSATGGKATSGGSSAGGSSAGGASSGGTGGSGGGAGIGGSVSAGAGGEAGMPGLCDDYVACGCGCCGPGPTEVGRCYYPEAGDERGDLIANDEAMQQRPICATAGCSIGLRHACCLRGSPEPAGSASYSAVLTSTALDRLAIAKQGNDGRCATIGFALPLASSSVYTALELPGPGWGLEFAYESACTMSALPPPAIGAIGKLTLRAEAGGCVVDAHLTAFFARNGGVQAVPFDADGLTLEGVSPSLCQ